jgi:hypothetical protein
MITNNTETNEENTQQAESDSVKRLVGSPNSIQEAWEVYHGDPPEGFEIPAAPPSYMRGFVDGVEHARNGSSLVVESYGRNKDNCNEFVIKFTNGKKIVISAVTAGEWVSDLFITKLIPS